MGGRKKPEDKMKERETEGGTVLRRRDGTKERESVQYGKKEGKGWRTVEGSEDRPVKKKGRNGGKCKRRRGRRKRPDKK